MVFRLSAVLLFVGLFFSVELFGQTVQKAVLFGHHAKHAVTKDATTLRIFMDMNGDFYPENHIKDSELRGNGNSQLRIWAQTFPTDFEKVAADYGLLKTRYSATNYQILQDSIIGRIIGSINTHPLSENQTWLIHGYRKELYEPEGIHDSTSLYDNRVVTQRINERLEVKKAVKPLYVEVYWDGKYMIYTGYRSIIRLGKLFRDHAVPNAQRCGYSLRKIFKGIDSDNINLISHSTGTHIVTHLLFNVKSTYTVETPDNKSIKVALVASASSGVDLFQNYYRRNTSYAYQEHDNYTIINVFNRRDNVLRKGGMARRYGHTTLGCNFRGESEKLSTYFQNNFPKSVYRQIPINAAPPGNHFFWRYANTEGFLELVDLLFP